MLANLRIGRADTTENEIKEAAKTARCHDFIMDSTPGSGKAEFRQKNGILKQAEVFHEGLSDGLSHYVSRRDGG